MKCRKELFEIIFWCFLLKHFIVRITLELLLTNLSDSFILKKCYLTSTFKCAIGLFLKLFFVDLMTIWALLLKLFSVVLMTIFLYCFELKILFMLVNGSTLNMYVIDSFQWTKLVLSVFHNMRSSSFGLLS